MAPNDSDLIPPSVQKERGIAPVLRGLRVRTASSVVDLVAAGFLKDHGIRQVQEVPRLLETKVKEASGECF